MREMGTVKATRHMYIMAWLLWLFEAGRKPLEGMQSLTKMTMMFST